MKPTKPTTPHSKPAHAPHGPGKGPVKSPVRSHARKKKKNLGKHLMQWVDPGHGHDSREDTAYMPDVEAAIRNSGHRLAYLLSLIAAFSIIIFVVWAHFAVLDEVTKADAKVIPSSKVQVIQSLDGGTVEELLVKEGDIVEKDQVLLKIDTTPAETN
jgi:hypothetical protein